MLINNDKTTSGPVKFISYTGEYPNLCGGVLTLEIEGKEYKFGHNWSKAKIHPNTKKPIFPDEDSDNPNFDGFWRSGGVCGFRNGDYNEPFTEQAEWMIDAEDIPEQFRKYAVEIDHVFNNNVPFGCCGGCL